MQAATSPECPESQSHMSMSSVTGESWKPIYLVKCHVVFLTDEPIYFPLLFLDFRPRTSTQDLSFEHSQSVGLPDELADLIASFITNLIDHTTASLTSTDTYMLLFPRYINCYLRKLARPSHLERHIPDSLDLQALELNSSF